MQKAPQVSERFFNALPGVDLSPLLVIGHEFQENPFRPQNERTSKPGWGASTNETKFGHRAKDLIQRAGGALDQEGLTHKSVFLTGTLPGSSEGAIDAISRWSGWIVNRVRTWLRDLSRRLVCTHYYFSVWELQKRGALHLHACVASESFIFRRFVENKWKNFWTQLIDQISEKDGIDLWERSGGGSWNHYKEVIRTDAQTVKKSIAGYISKYTSKDAGKSQENGTNRFPSRWWSMCRGTKALISKYERKFVISLSKRQENYIRTQIIYRSLGSMYSLDGCLLKYSKGRNLYIQLDREVTTQWVNELLEDMRFLFEVPVSNLEANRMNKASVFKTILSEYHRIRKPKYRMVETACEIYCRHFGVRPYTLGMLERVYGAQWFLEFASFCVVYDGGCNRLRELYNNSFSLAERGELSKAVYGILVDRDWESMGTDRGKISS